MGEQEGSLHSSSAIDTSTITQLRAGQAKEIARDETATTLRSICHKVEQLKELIEAEVLAPRVTSYLSGRASLRVYCWPDYLRGREGLCDGDDCTSIGSYYCMRFRGRDKLLESAYFCRRHMIHWVVRHS